VLPTEKIPLAFRGVRVYPPPPTRISQKYQFATLEPSRSHNITYIGQGQKNVCLGRDPEMLNWNRFGGRHWHWHWEMGNK